MPTIRETIQKVRDFAELPEGWHFGEGLPPSQGRIGQAIGFLEYAQFSDLERANAFPGINGQVEVTFYRADRMLEITIEADDSITIAEDRDREQISLEENLSQSDAYQRLEEFSQSVWAFSDPFIGSTMIRSVAVAAFQVAPWTSGIESPFPWWRSSAQLTRAGHYVHIFPSTTTSRLATLKFTGPYVTAIFQVPAESNLRQQLVGTTVIGTSTAGAETPLVELSSV